MKSIAQFSLILFSTLMLLGTTHAQFKVGARAGLGTFDVDGQRLEIFDQEGRQEFFLTLEESRYSYHFGLWMHFEIGSIFLRPEMIFNSNSADFRIFDEDDPDIANDIFSEKYQFLDFPILFGFRLGPVRLNAGPVGHVFLNSVSDLVQFDDYDENFQTMTFGYQAGVGLDIWKLVFDVRYEGNVNNFGDHIRFFGRSYEFGDRPSRLMASVGIEF